MRILLNGLGLINQHDGNVVPDLIDKLAFLTDQTVFFIIEFYRFFALGTGEDIE